MLSTRHFKQRTMEYSANGRDIEELDRGGIYHGVILRLRGQLTLGTPGTNNQPADILRGDAWACVRQIRIRVNSNDTIYDLSGPSALKDAYFFGAGRHAQDRLGQLGDSTTTNPSFDSLLYIPFAPPRWRAGAALPDMALDSRPMSKLELEIFWADHTAIASAATGFTTAPTIDVEGLIAYPDKLDTPPFPGFMRRYEVLEQLSATNQRFQVDLAVGKLYWGFVFNSIVDGADNAASFNNFRIKSGSTIYADFAAATQQEVARQKYGLQREFGGALFTDLMVGDANDVDGWVYYQHPFDGNLREGINTTAKSTFEIEMDVTKQGTTHLINTIAYEWIAPARSVG